MIALSASAVIALVQVTNANDKLSTSLIATGARLGFTTEYAQGLATVLSGMGATRVDVLNAFSEISKSGNITAESFLQVAEAADDLEFYNKEKAKFNTFNKMFDRFGRKME